MSKNDEKKESWFKKMLFGLFAGALAIGSIGGVKKLNEGNNKINVVEDKIDESDEFRKRMEFDGDINIPKQMNDNTEFIISYEDIKNNVESEFSKSDSSEIKQYVKDEYEKNYLNKYGEKIEITKIEGINRRNQYVVTILCEQDNRHNKVLEEVSYDSENGEVISSMVSNGDGIYSAGMRPMLSGTIGMYDMLEFATKIENSNDGENNELRENLYKSIANYIYNEQLQNTVNDEPEIFD